jgi:DNA repair protein RadD
VLDFAGVVEMHGPITAVQPPKKGGEGNGEAPVKVCDNCAELCALSVRCCPACGHDFPPPPEKKLELRTDDIMGLDGTEQAVTDWRWRVHISRSSGKSMLAVTYYAGLTDKGVTEYLPILHDGFAGQKATRQLLSMAKRSGADLLDIIDLTDETALDAIVVTMNKATPPALIEYRRDGKFDRILRREWNER